MDMKRPQVGDYNVFYQGYIDKVLEQELLESLVSAHQQTQAVLASIEESKGEFRYAEGKWSVKEVIGHMMDCERIMAYRALRFARQDDTPLAGFDENIYSQNSNVDAISIRELSAHFQNLRNSTVDLFTTFSEEMLDRPGEANGSTMTVLALGYIVSGHELHHLSVLRERYLDSN
jgi:uncharacterized damage-inducible protein DinB